MQLLLHVANGIDTFMSWVGKVAYWIGGFMILVGFYNVVARYVGEYVGVNLSSNAFIEGQTHLFTLFFFLGFAYVLRRDGHVRVDFLYSNFPRRRKAWVNLLGTLFFLIPFCILGITVTIAPVMTSWRFREGSPNPGGLPVYPLKTMILVAFGLLILQGISEVIKNLAVLTGHKPAVIAPVTQEQAPKPAAGTPVTQEQAPKPAEITPVTLEHVHKEGSGDS